MATTQKLEGIEDSRSKVCLTSKRLQFFCSTILSCWGKQRQCWKMMPFQIFLKFMRHIHHH